MKHNEIYNNENMTRVRINNVSSIFILILMIVFFVYFNNKQTKLQETVEDVSVELFDAKSHFKILDSLARDSSTVWLDYHVPDSVDVLRIFDKDTVEIKLLLSIE